MLLPNVTPLLSGSEVARPTFALYLVPEKTCPLIYMNSSAADVERENVAGEVNLKPRRDFNGGGVDVKGNPQNCESFNVAVDVSAFCGHRVACILQKVGTGHGHYDE